MRPVTKEEIEVGMDLYTWRRVYRSKSGWVREILHARVSEIRADGIGVESPAMKGTPDEYGWLWDHQLDGYYLSTSDAIFACVEATRAEISFFRRKMEEAQSNLREAEEWARKQLGADNCRDKG